MTAPKANEPTNIPMKEPMDLKKAAAVKFSSEYSSTVLKVEKKGHISLLAFSEQKTYVSSFLDIQVYCLPKY